MRTSQDDFRAFFEAEYRPLRRLGYLLTGDWVEAEDLVQETMVRTYRAWNRIRERERPGAYARSVLVNRRNSLLRRAMVEAKHAVARRTPDSVVVDFGEEGMVLWDALRVLPARQRDAIVLRYYEDLSEAEVALIMNLPLGTVKSLVHRGIGRLRKRIGGEDLIPNGSEA